MPGPSRQATGRKTRSNHFGLSASLLAVCEAAKEAMDAAKLASETAQRVAIAAVAAAKAAAAATAVADEERSAARSRH